MPNVRLLPRTTAFGLHDQGFVTLLERCTDHLPAALTPDPRERLWKVRAKQVVLATGAHDRPLVFANNDLPGVMLASAVVTYVRRYAVVPSRQAVVFTNNDRGYELLGRCTRPDPQSPWWIVEALLRQPWLVAVPNPAFRFLRDMS